MIQYIYIAVDACAGGEMKMSRNIEMRAYLNFDEISKIKEAVAQRKLTYNTDSELIRKVFFDYSTKIMDLAEADEIIKWRIKEYGEKIAMLEKNIEHLQAVIQDKNNELDILKHNISIPKKQKKVKK